VVNLAFVSSGRENLAWTESLAENTFRLTEYQLDNKVEAIVVFIPVASSTARKRTGRDQPEICLAVEADQDKNWSRPM
jgi:hypothetical protein